MKKLALFLACAAISGTALADVHISDAWVRSTVPAQKATGAFMHLHADQDARLKSASSPVAGVVQLHEMAMDNNVMRMRETKAIDLKKDQVVELKPGSYHIMLMGLKQAVAPNTSVPITLVFENQKDGKTFEKHIKAPVRALGAAPQGNPQDHAGHAAHSH